MVQGVTRLAQRTGCVHCRLYLIRAFTGVSYPSPHATQLRREASIPRAPQQARSFTSAQWRRAEQPLSSPVGESSPVGKDAAEDQVDEEEAASDSIPWYLQGREATPAPRPLSNRQRIPELPEAPPPVLEPLLQHISVELGMDDLSLIDLRDLDPPPALGSNLLMILGTARSEKHLHVSADRLCRWLRTEYKLRPDADGLLGRNELKLKLKRRNKRAKLLGNAMNQEDVDDGVRTGWICVNVGEVPSAPDAKKHDVDQEPFIGFGRQSDGTKIVVQLMVEEKREELDLERLWNGMRERQAGPAASVSVEDITQEGGVNSVAPSGQVRSGNPFSVQTRAIHTSARRPSEAAGAVESASLARVDRTITLDSPMPSEFDTFCSEIGTYLGLGDYKAAGSLLNGSSIPSKKLGSDSFRALQYNCLRDHIQSLTNERLLEELGPKALDQSDTPLLRYLSSICSSSPSFPDWEFQIWLHCFAHRHGHPGYPAHLFQGFIHKLQLSGCNISRELYLMVLRSALSAHAELTADPRAQDAQLNIVVKVIQDMYARTGQLLTDDVFLTIWESISAPTPSSLSSDIHSPIQIETHHLPLAPKTDLQTRLLALMHAFQVPRLTHPDLRIKLLSLFAQHNHWDAFWLCWRSIAREGEPRSPEMYAAMFSLVGATANQKACMSVLREWVPEIELEEPKVELRDGVVRSVMECVKVAEPQIEGLSADSEAKGEWVRLWRRCVSGGL
jgi:hypothetical protein